jgi:hypothetical protein
VPRGEGATVRYLLDWAWAVALLGGGWCVVDVLEQLTRLAKAIRRGRP